MALYDDTSIDKQDEKKQKKVIAIRVILEGRVQKVGLRVWIKEKAALRNLDGWVRNKSNGSVEALFAGEEHVVKEMVRICHQGSPFSMVKRVREFPQKDTESISQGFEILSTV